jgi:hypothetical protein
LAVFAVSLLALSPLASSAGSGAGVSAPRIQSVLESGDPYFTGGSRTSGDVAGSVTPAVRGAETRRCIAPLRRSVVSRRARTWAHQDALGLERTPTARKARATVSCKYLHWIVRRWSLRADTHWRIWARLQWDTRAAICFVFKGYCGQALAVFTCEAGDPPSVNATNGQYLGIAQMGAYARGRYGHSSSALGQARAAYAYFVDSGRDWSPWQCRPDGGLRW